MIFEYEHTYWGKIQDIDCYEKRYDIAPHIVVNSIASTGGSSYELSMCDIKIIGGDKFTARSRGTIYIAGKEINITYIKNRFTGNVRYEIEPYNSTSELQ